MFAQSMYLLILVMALVLLNMHFCIMWLCIWAWKDIFKSGDSHMFIITNTHYFFYKKPVYKKPDAGASKRLRNFQYWYFLLQKIKKLSVLIFFAPKN